MTYPKVGEIVAGDIRAAEILKKAGIDFCCGGGISLERACEKKGLNPDEVMSEINNHLEGTPNNGIDFKYMPMSVLADYIEAKHHAYVRESIDFIDPLLNKVVRVHGDAHPELNEVSDLFFQSVNELSLHMKKEENTVFPLIKALEEGRLKELDPDASVKHPIEMMEDEHTTEGDRFKRIQELTNNYTPPADGCNTYRLVYHKLKEFNEDLEQHIHLENNILFPRAIKKEEEL